MLSPVKTMRKLYQRWYNREGECNREGSTLEKVVVGTYLVDNNIIDEQGIRKPT